MRRLVLAMAAILAAGCGEMRISGSPQETLTANLLFYQFHDDAFAAAEKSGSFWAVRGQARSLTLRYGDTGAEFLRFDVGPNSLTVQDSVLISVTVDGSRRFQFNFEPSGLKFAGDAPAVLTLDFTRASGPPLPAIYSRDDALLPWTLLPTDLLGTRASARVKHFTDFALAAN